MDCRLILDDNPKTQWLSFLLLLSLLTLLISSVLIIFWALSETTCGEKAQAVLKSADSRHQTCEDNNFTPHGFCVCIEQSQKPPKE